MVEYGRSWQDRVLNVLAFLFFIFVLVFGAYFAANAAEPPAGLWRAIVAEAADQGYEGMYAVACCVKNRIERGNTIGLCGAKRPDFFSFTEKQGENTAKQAKMAVRAVFVENGPDVTKGATLFENVHRFGFPKSWDRLKVVAVADIGDHTFFVEE